MNVLELKSLAERFNELGGMRALYDIGSDEINEAHQLLAEAVDSDPDYYQESLEFVQLFVENFNY